MIGVEQIPKKTNIVGQKGVTKGGGRGKKVHDLFDQLGKEGRGGGEKHHSLPR